VSETAQPRRSWFLIVSLCVNVILLVIIVMGTIRNHREQEAIATAHAFSPRSMMQLVGPEDAAKIQSVMKAHEARIIATLAASHKARAEAFAAFRAPNFDPAAFKAALARMRAADAAFEQENTAQLADSAAQLGAADRARIADNAKAKSRARMKERGEAH